MAIVFNSVSSDNNLFDFDHVIRRVMKESGLSNEGFMTRLRFHFKHHHPGANDAEVASAVAYYLMAPMNWEKFVRTMDVLNSPISISVSLNPLVTGKLDDGG